VLALVVGVTTGAVLALVAGARRTDSAYSRFLASHAPADLLISESSDFGITERVDLDAIAALPGVADSARASTIFIGSGLTEGGKPLRAGYFVPFAPADDRLGKDVNRWKLLEGRRADPSRVDEVVLSFEAARVNALAVGDHFDVRFVDQPSFLAALPTFVGCVPDRVAGRATGECADVGLQSVQNGPRLRFEVVGIEASAGEFPPLPGNVLPPVHMTRAFTERYAASLARSDVLYIRLRPGVTDGEFLRDAQALDPGATLTVFSVGRDNAANASRAMHFQAIGLGLLALVVGVSITFALAQAFARQAFVAVDDDARTLRALGMGTAQFAVLGAVRAATTAIVGAALAVLVAVALSPIWPVGLAGKAEPDPGLAVDGVVLLIGSAILVGLAAIVAAATSARVARRDRRRARSARVSWVSPLVTRWPVPTAVGVRHAVDPGRGRSAVPVRSAIVAGALTVATLVAAALYATSSDHLLETRRLYGWSHDAQIGSAGLPAVAGVVVAGLDQRDDVAAISMGTVAELDVAGQRVSAFALDALEGAPSPVLLQGRRARSDDEIVLGSTTMRQAGLSVGDRVTVRTGDASSRMRIVGRAVFSKIGDNGQLGRGAQLTLAGLSTLTPDPPANVVHVRFAAGVDDVRARQDLRVALDAVPVIGPTPPNDVTGFARVESLPLILGTVMILVTAAILVHTLVSSVRRRRFDFAVLEVFGFRSRQRALAVSTEATTFVTLALIVGVPLGLVVGRTGWAAIARELGVDSRPRVDPVLVGLLAVGLVVIANVAAAIPARLASRSNAAESLRAP
jgi:hypothetical protein